MWVTFALESHRVWRIDRNKSEAHLHAIRNTFSVFICVHHNCGQFGKRWPSFSTFHFLSITLSWTFTRVAKFRPSSLQFPVNRYFLHLCAPAVIYIYVCECMCMYTFPRERFSSFNSSWTLQVPSNRTKLDFDRWNSMKYIATIALSLSLSPQCNSHFHPVRKG